MALWPVRRPAAGSSFNSFFSPYSAPRYPVERPIDSSRAPSPRKLDVQPTGGSVLVLGDSMADWLAYGLEDALGDPPDLAVVRKNRASSGLIRYDSRNETQDWAQVIRETIAADQAEVHRDDGRAERSRVDPRSRGDSRPSLRAPRRKRPCRPAASATGTAGGSARCQIRGRGRRADAGEQPAAETQTRGGVTTTTYRVYEFRTDEWAASYTKRIDATIAALKSAGVPVFWVGLPSIRGPKSTSDLQYLNDLYRARAEKAGISYIDVWDGFRRRKRPLHPAGAGLRGPDPPAARRRRRAFHQGRRAQARALSRA